MISALFSFLLGACGWTLVEYLLHRFVFHGPSAKGLGAREHRRHHAAVDYFAPWWQKAIAAIATTAMMLPIAALIAGLEIGAARHQRAHGVADNPRRSGAGSIPSRHPVNDRIGVIFRDIVQVIGH